jgi:tetratricopeptide (TPR) repeat protein
MANSRSVSRAPSPASDAVRHFGAAVAAFERGAYETAIRELDVVLRLVPGNPDALCLRGAANNHLDRHEQALGDLARGTAVLGQPSSDTRDAFNEYGIALRATGDLDSAERVLRELLDAAPDYATAWHNLALVLESAKRYDEGAAAARRATTLEPESAGLLMLLGKLLRRQGRLHSAAAALRRAYQLAPDDPTLNTTLGNTLFYLGEIDEAIACFARSAQLLAESPAMLTNYATMLSAIGRHADALAVNDRALALQPGDPEAVVRRAATLLNLGRLGEGWDAFEARMTTQAKARRWQGTPEWDGSSLHERSLLVYREQGIGDEIMFASCYPQLVELADHVIIECDERLEKLFTRSFPSAAVHAQTNAGDTPDDEPAPAHPGADVASAAGSVCRWLRRTIDDFPAAPAYLRPDPEEVERFRARLRLCGPGPYVGISWRSMIRTAERRLEYTRLDEWGAILRTAGITFVLLQYDQCEREVVDAEARFGIPVHRWRDLDLMNDFDRVAALMGALDLVIAPRNAVAMLGGAVGVPTLAIGNVGDWSECGTGQLPWFSSVECINRHVTDGWEPVLGELAARVRGLAAGVDPVRAVHQRKAIV